MHVAFWYYEENTKTTDSSENTDVSFAWKYIHNWNISNADRISCKNINVLVYAHVWAICAEYIVFRA